ncbi:hypothetical protein [Kouleothrix sp.]|uniref:hypothetical protein n=1 Tax=Kouleothrix sp. TaxID=2779161 RepID=UPI0039188BC0
MYPPDAPDRGRGEWRWQRYLTNVLDPKRLSIVEVVALYDARWKRETSFLLIKRLLDRRMWVGSQNGIWLQVVATFLMYALLLDLCDDVAQALGVQLEAISVEMVYRGLYHYVWQWHRVSTKETRPAI